MIVGEQLRAARALLRLEQGEVASRSGVSIETIKRMERGVGEITGRSATIDSVVRAYTQAGVQFIAPAGPLGAGVRLVSVEQKAKAERTLAKLRAKGGGASLSARELLDLADLLEKEIG